MLCLLLLPALCSGRQGTLLIFARLIEVFWPHIWAQLRGSAVTTSYCCHMFLTWSLSLCACIAAGYDPPCPLNMEQLFPSATYSGSWSCGGNTVTEAGGKCEVSGDKARVW